MSAANPTSEPTVPRQHSSVPNPPIRTLKVELRTGNSFIPIIPNAREATLFDMEFFGGKAMIMIRTAPIDTHFENFFLGRRRLFEVQVQGKFKRMPNGEVYVGAEATSKMELGILTRSISLAAMKLCSTMVTDMHYSFGDSPSSPTYQLPHVVGPIFPTFDKVIVTPPGEEPPELGVPFTEEVEFRKIRTKYRSVKEANIDLESIYSFSVNTSNLNLLDWTLVGIPMVKPMDMRTFFGNSSIQLIGYEVPKTVITKYPNLHPQNSINYVFCMKLTPCEPSDLEQENVEENLPLVDLPIICSDDDHDDNDGAEDGVGGMKEDRRGAASDKENGSESDNDSDEFIEVGGEMSPDVAALTNKKDKLTMRGWFKKKFRQMKPANNAYKEDAITHAVSAEEPELVDGDYDLDFELSEDLNYCPCTVEINDIRRGGKPRIFYILPVTNLDIGASSSSPSPPITSTGYDIAAPRVRSFSTVSKYLPLVDMPKLPKNKRLSSIEKRRRLIAESYRQLINKPENANAKRKFASSLTEISDSERYFLSGNNLLVVRQVITSSTNKSFEGTVALATSRRHFLEQYMVLTNESLILKRTADSRKLTVKLRAESILCVTMAPIENCPVPDFGFLQIETFARVYYIMARSNLQVNEWMQAFITVFGSHIMVPDYRLKQQNNNPPPHVSQQVNVDLISAKELDREDFYIARPTCWKLDKKRIYNYRRIQFKVDKKAESGGTKDSNSKDNNAVSNNLPASVLIKRILSSAFYLSHLLKDEMQRGSDQDWIRFLDDLSSLQTVDLSKMGESERMAFFLNLYHVMVLHGSLVFGPPPAWNHWNAFFNQICYVVSGELISMAELEYCILRANMSKLSLFTAVAMPAPPTTLYPSLALQSRDFRLHFAINCGSCSMLDEVPIYDGETLDNQLDLITMRSLEDTIEIDAARKIIIMPKLPLTDYFIDKGGHTTSTKATSAAIHCLFTLLPYLNRQNRIALKAILADPQHINIRHRTFNFKCRMLLRMSEYNNEGHER